MTSNKKCKSKKCGCQDTMLTTPNPCPTPVGCPTPNPCSEVINAQCIIYTGDSLDCNGDIIVPVNTNVEEAFNNIVEYFCNNSSRNCNSLEWNDIDLNNGWTTNGPSYFDFQYQTPQYAINSCTNQVYLRGTFFILEGDPDPNIPDAFTLPVGFRPSNVRWYPNQTMPASGFDNFGGSTFIAVLPDGRVIPSEVAGTNANATLFYCLDGIVFETN